jgi:RNA polymerase sigma-70 factor, ECF subfamily
VDELESLYRAGLPRFIRAAAAIVGDEATGRDAVQEAFAQAVKKRASFKGEAALEAWVWRIVINEAVALRRRRAPESQSVTSNGAAPLTEHLAEQDGAAPSTEHLAEQDGMVRAWVASLPERQRLAIFLRYFANLDYRSIAAALDVEVGTVSATLATSLAALRRASEEALR